VIKIGLPFLIFLSFFIWISVLTSQNVQLRTEVGQLKDNFESLKPQIDKHDSIVHSITVPRSCEDYFKKGLKHSRFLPINPSGKGQSFQAYCNVTTRSTMIFHDKIDDKFNFRDCQDPECIRMNVNYEAPIDELRMLIGDSLACHQDIKVHLL
jgi:hypothetical protein